MRLMLFVDRRAAQRSSIRACTYASKNATIFYSRQALHTQPFFSIDVSFSLVRDLLFFEVSHQGECCRQLQHKVSL